MEIEIFFVVSLKYTTLRLNCYIAKSDKWPARGPTCDGYIGAPDEFPLSGHQINL